MENAKFELLLEKLQQEQDRFRYERECRHLEFERRLGSFRARHDHLVGNRIRRLSLDGITLNVDEIKKQAREDSILQRDSEISLVTTKLERLQVTNDMTLSLRREKTEGDNDFRIKKLLTFDSRYPTPLPHLIGKEETNTTPLPQPVSQIKLHTGVAAKQNFRRIGRKVNNLVRFSSGRRHTIASHHPPQGHVPLHVNTIGAEFKTTKPLVRVKTQIEENVKRDPHAFEPSMPIIRAKTQLGFEDSIKRDSHTNRHLSVPHIQHMSHGTTRYPKLAIGRQSYIQMCKGLKTPKQKLQSVVAKLDTIKQFSVNVR